MRSQLTRNIDILYPALQDEVVAAFDDILDLKDDGDMFPVIKNNKSLMLGNIEWRSVPVLTTIQKIVCRASNRSFVGLPLCMYSLSSSARVFKPSLQAVTRITWLSTSSIPLIPSQGVLPSGASRKF